MVPLPPGVGAVGLCAGPLLRRGGGCAVAWLEDGPDFALRGVGIGGGGGRAVARLEDGVQFGLRGLGVPCGWWIRQGGGRRARGEQQGELGGDLLARAEGGDAALAQDRVDVRQGGEQVGEGAVTGAQKCRGVLGEGE